MDLKGWEKLEEDDSSVTLRHPRGHTMRIAVKALPRIQREQIKRLNFAEGGAVKAQKLLKKSRGQSVQGGYVEDDDMDKAKDSAELRAEKERKIKPKMKNLAGGGEVKYYNNNMEPVEGGSQDQNQDQPDQPQQAPQGTTININAAQPQQPQVAPVPVPVKPMPVSPASNIVGSMQPAAVPQPVVPTAVSNINPNGQLNPSGVMQNTQAAALGKKNIESAEAQGHQQLEGELAGADTSLEQRRQQRLADMAQHVQDAETFLTDPKHTDPMRFGHDLKTGQKIGTAIGLFLGGMGVPFGGHNYALDFLNKQIDRDIDAQKQMIDNHKTVLGAYQDLYGKGNAADALTKATMYDVYNARMRQQAAQLGTARASQRYLEAAPLLAIERSKAIKDAGVDITAIPGYTGKGQGIGNVAPAKTPDQGKNESGPKYQILSPGAEKRYQQIMAGYDPQWSPKSDQVDQQYTAAQQSEKVLNGPKGDGVGGIHDLMNEMHSLVSSSDDSGTKKWLTHAFARGEGALGSIPVVGHGLQGLAQAVPQPREVERYNSLSKTLVTDIGTALNGIVPPSEVEGIVQTNLPSYGDTEADKARKEQAIINMILKANKTSRLHAIKGMTKD